jgi:RNA polymerase sigma factor (sigma-70 family)
MQDNRVTAPLPQLLESNLLDAVAQRFRPMLVGYFRKRVRDAAEAEDLTQEVFLRVLRRCDVAAISDVRSYLFETALSVLIDRSRRDKARHKIQHAAYAAEDHMAVDFPSERVLLGREALRTAHAVLRDMPERTRTIFVLRRLEGMKYSEIAVRLGISVSAVEKHMLRAMLLLTERMGDT